MAPYGSYREDSYSDSGYGGGGFSFGAPGGGGTPPGVKGLVIANIVVYFLQLVLGRFTTFDYGYYFALNTELAIDRFWVWQFVTSMFLHHPERLFHVIFNMFALWMFGREVEARLGTRRFLVFYFLAGMFAALCFAVVGVLGARFALMVGASGAVMGVLVLFAIYFPEATLLAFFVIPVKAKHLVMFVIVIDLVYFVFLSDSSQVAHSAHLGGALFGWLYHRYHGRVEQYLASVDAKEQRRAKENERDVRAEVDRLLDKIAAGESITPKERRFLGKASRKYYGKSNR